MTFDRVLGELLSVRAWTGPRPAVKVDDRLSSTWIGGDGAVAPLLHLQVAERPLSQALATIGFALHPAAAQRLRHLTSAR